MAERATPSGFPTGPESSRVRAVRSRDERRLRRAGVEVIEQPKGFDAGRSLRRAGFTARQGVGRAASQYGRAGGYFARQTGLKQVGVGSFLIFAGFSIIGLALLRAALGGRGPAAVDRLFSLAGGGLSKLLSPSDPIVGHGTPAAPPSPSSAVVTDAAAAGVGAVAGLTTAGKVISAAKGAIGAVLHLVTIPASLTQRPGIQVNRPWLPAVEAIAAKFGVKVSSGYRSPAANSEAGGAVDSDHLRGNAVDFVGSLAAMNALYAWATKQKFPYVEPYAQSVGSSEPHVHISFA